jgi:adenosylcobinamide-GDP ribazoletransferase
MTHLRSAIRFMTVLPAGPPTGFDAVAMAPWFPVVGLLVGGLTAAADALAGRGWGPGTVAVLDVLLLAGLTGAFHLDGLADTADGLFSHRPRERVLEIMKDSRIGSMGVVALCGVLAVKWAGIGALHDHRALLLFLVPAYARGGILFAMRRLPYGRPEGGTGLAFFRRTPSAGAFWAVGLTGLLSLALGPAAVALNAAFALVVAGLIAFYRRQLGCITGDMLGAMIEVTEAALFLVAAIEGGR